MADQGRRLDGVVLTIDGRPLATDLYGRLTLARVEESVHLPDYFALHFDDPHFELFDRGTFTLGTRVEIAFRAEGDPVVVTTGEVTAVAVQPGVTGRHELVLSGLDLTHRLARGPKSRSFQRVTDADIATRIAGEYGLEPNVDGTGEVLEHVLQAGESDYAFLRRRAARIGFDFWISDRTFHFKRGPRGSGTPPVLRWGGNLHSFTVRFASAEHCDEVEVRGWDPLAKQAVIGRASEGDPGTDAPAATELTAAARRSFGRVTRSAGQFPVADQAEAAALARSFLLRTSAGGVVLRGEAAGDPLLGAGAEVRVEQVGQRLAGRYRVTSVEHSYGANRPYRTRFVCGGKDAAALADLAGGTGSADGSARGWGGLVTGIVTNNDDPERLGRVKVTFPTLSADDESTWARVAAPGAGPGRGLQWLPEVDDEVLVGFEFGDLARPVVLGGVWSRQDQPPQPDVVSGGVVAARVLASRADSRLTLTDDPTPAVELTLAGGSCALHLEQAESSLTGDQKLVVSATQVEIRATQKLQLSGAQVEINASGPLVLSGKPIKLN
ncbi:VgrG-related protein [Plantactinospora solaniradicis]|uniref:VgrG-related protein n=1 Tax=Plantactinospora solaniradicis TaxID=1723736 RepID=A0ABW1K6Z4_9ACTN